MEPFWGITNFELEKMVARLAVSMELIRKCDNKEQHSKSSFKSHLLRGTQSDLGPVPWPLATQSSSSTS